MVEEPAFLTFRCPNPAPDKGTRNLALWQWGNAGNPRVVVCVHGLARNARDFDFLARTLAQDYRVLAFDMPGRGGSGWLSNPAWYNPATYIADMLHVLHQLGIRQVDWIGTSMGGIIAMLLASQPNGFIRKMALNDIGPFLPAEALRKIASYVSEGGSRFFSGREEAEAFLRQTYQAAWGIHDAELWEHFVTHSLRRESDSWRLHYDPAIAAGFRDEEGNIKPLENMDLWEQWESIACPVFLMRGQHSEVLTRDTAERMRASGKICDFKEIPDCAHAPSLMEPAQIRMIREWLD